MKVYFYIRVYAGERERGRKLKSRRTASHSIVALFSPKKEKQQKKIFRANKKTEAPLVIGVRSVDLHESSYDTTSFFSANSKLA